MAMSEKQFMTMAANFSNAVDILFERVTADMTPEQIEMLLGVLSGNLAALMERHIGRAAMAQNFVKLGNHYREQGAGEGTLQ